MLERFLEDKILFEETIDLLISDNCSTDDLESCVNEFKSKGLKITYNRNQKNLGPDGNFLYCFNHAKGKYCWLLGSDDIPVKGFLNSLVTVLQGKEYGLVHLNHHSDGLSQLFEYSDNQKMVENIAHWITFMSSNIINTKNIAFINSNQYMDTYLIQVPYYLYSCLNSPVNAIYKYSCFEKDDDSANNGSYNLFQVFVQNLFDVYERFYQQKMLSRKVIENIKRNEYAHFLFPFIKDLLVLKKKSNFDKKHAWHILFRCYGLKWYFYSYPIMYVVKKAIIDFCN